MDVNSTLQLARKVQPPFIYMSYIHEG
jgi:hypothetical protein